MKMIAGALASVEEVTHAACTDTDEHFDKVRTGNGVEGNLSSPATARASSVLPVPGGTVEQHALGDLRADGLELGRLLRNSLISTSSRMPRRRPHISERRLGMSIDCLGLGLAEVHDLRAATLHLAHEEEQHRMMIATGSRG